MLSEQQIADDQSRIVLDVWGGECSMDHIARFLPQMPNALAIAERELRAGYLVNMRAETAWGGLVPFDARIKLAESEGVLQ